MIDRRARIATLEKAFAVLELFGPEAPELRIADIAARAGMNRSSAQRIVHTLVKSCWLRRDDRGLLSLGHRVGYPAHVYLAACQLTDLVMPLVVDLNARTGLSCDLWLLDGDEAVTLARAPSPASVLALAPVGSRVSLGGAAPGRAFLAAMAPEALTRRLTRHAAMHGDAEAETLAHRVVAEREAGYAHDTPRESAVGRLIAAAFRDASGKPLAAVSVSGMRDAEAARKIGVLLGETVSRASELRAAPTARPADIEPNARYIWPLADDEGDPLAITAVAKSLHLLQFFHPATPLLTLTELSRQTGFPVPTVQRITDTLIGLGYLAKDEKKRAFHISVRALDLLYRFQMGSSLIRSVWPHLVRLRDECGLCCSFCILDGTEIIHLLHVLARPYPDFRTAYPGRRLPAVSSSGGRAILALLPEEEMEAVLAASVMEPGTPFTVTDKRAIRAEILAARQEGVAFTDRQSIRDEVNVGAALAGPKGRPIGAIVVSAPVRSWSIERLKKDVLPLLLPHTHSSLMPG